MDHRVWVFQCTTGRNASVGCIRFIGMLTTASVGMGTVDDLALCLLVGDPRR